MKFFSGVFILLLSPCTFSGLYSLQTKVPISWEDVLRKNRIVIITTQNCKACDRLRLELERCHIPRQQNKVALVTDQTFKINNSLNQYVIYITSRKWIEKLTSVTPLTYIDGKRFKEGFFFCKEIQ